MPRKPAETDTPDPIEPVPESDIVPPKYYAATDDPAHPLHHHAKRDSLESPTPEE